ncbi:MAG: DNA-binding LytR/AlgR family response regulator [Paraglaciecola sp.]|jgi:DNA-binding LytR/AlgR family response regulator
MIISNILILENDDELSIELSEMLQRAGFQGIVKVDNIDDIDVLLAEKQIDFTIVGFSFLERNGKMAVLKKFETANIPVICLFPNESFDNEDLLTTNQPYALIGEVFSEKSLRKTIENTLFSNKKEEYLTLRKRLLLDDHIYIKTGSQLEKINVSKILCVSSDGNYSMVQTEERKYAIKRSLKKMLEELPSESFIQIHRGYLVQRAKISKVNIAENKVFIGEQVFPLGRYYKSDVLSRLNKLG